MVQLEAILSSSKGTQFVTVVTDTVPKMRSLHNPYFGKVIKRCKRNAVVNASYESVVNKRLTRLIKLLQSSEITPEIQEKIDGLISELPFVAGPRAWGKRRRGTPFVDYTGKVYLEIIVLKELSCSYISTKDGSEIPVSQLERYLTEREGELVKIRDYHIENLNTITLRNQTYSLIRKRGVDKRQH
jgi:hypothetical protein